VCDVAWIHRGIHVHRGLHVLDVIHPILVDRIARLIR
jgi:hypothetical protein